jgi:hypothetical protein
MALVPVFVAGGGVEWSLVVFSLIKPRYRRVCAAAFVAGWPCLLFIFYL